VLEIPNQRPEATHICIPDTEAAKTLCEQALYQSTMIPGYTPNYCKKKPENQEDSPKHTTKRRTIIADFRKIRCNYW
jgi:hypothetical protein